MSPKFNKKKKRNKNLIKKNLKHYTNYSLKNQENKKIKEHVLSTNNLKKK